MPRTRSCSKAWSSASTSMTRKEGRATRGPQGDGKGLLVEERVVLPAKANKTRGGGMTQTFVQVPNPHLGGVGNGRHRPYTRDDFPLKATTSQTADAKRAAFRD